MQIEFYKCEICGNIVAKIVDGKGELVCCGKPMHLLKAGEIDAAQEKHVPKIEKKGNEVNVKVGEVDHPMTEEHYIQWVALETDKGIKINKWVPNQKPETTFPIPPNANVIKVYAYCNLHGLWVATL
ncbi:MAG: desulfoferrodoxin family protein [Eubacteriales bacterium]|nr:desulfoferrodoxin family protein [Eubacteriales bacterium]